MITDASLAEVLRLLCPKATLSSIDRAIEVLHNGGLPISRVEWPPLNRKLYSFSDNEIREAAAYAAIDEIRRQARIDSSMRRKKPRACIEVRRIDEMTDYEFERFCERNGG